MKVQFTLTPIYKGQGSPCRYMSTLEGALCVHLYFHPKSCSQCQQFLCHLRYDRKKSDYLVEGKILCNKILPVALPDFIIFLFCYHLPFVFKTIKSKTLELGAITDIIISTDCTSLRTLVFVYAKSFIAILRANSTKCTVTARSAGGVRTCRAISTKGCDASCSTANS